MLNLYFLSSDKRNFCPERFIGLGLSKEQLFDPWYIYYSAINYMVGSAYAVHEHEVEGLHSCLLS